MLPMVVGLAIFLGIHLLPASPELRQGLIGRYGEGAYKIGFALVSLVGFALIVIGFHKLQLHPEKAGPLWDPPTWTRSIAHLLMLPALICLAAANIPSKIKTTLKHPMLVSVKLWAFAHLIAAGSSVAAVLLFGSFLAYAVYDRISYKWREGSAELAAAPQSYAGDLAAIAIGSALYAALLLGGHTWLIGVPVSSISVF
ncbi:MAG: NnrU family protein [Alphaproteobacteria bacterium]|nr:NnrU family protein [Alphaproteobacteria bacterium]